MTEASPTAAIATASPIATAAVAAAGVCQQCHPLGVSGALEVHYSHVNPTSQTHIWPCMPASSRRKPDCSCGGGEATEQTAPNLMPKAIDQIQGWPAAPEIRLY